MVLIIGIPISWGIGGFCGTKDPGPRKIEEGGLGFCGVGGGGDAGFVAVHFGVGRLQAGEGAGGWLQAPAKFANISSLQMS